MSLLERHLIHDINEITEALSSGECRKLVYLCGSLETDCSPEFIKAMLKSKMECHGNAPLFLKALISQLGRYDILKRVYNTGRREIEQQIQTYGNLLPTFRILMVKISEELPTRDMEEIKFLLSNTLSREKMEKSKSFLDVVTELEKLDSVSPDRVEFVEKCLQDIGRLDLVKRVNAYKMSVGRSAEVSSQQQSRRVAGTQQKPGLNFAGTSAVQSCRAAVIKQTPPQHAAAKVNVSLPVCREPSRGSQLEHYNFNSNPRGVCVIIDCVGNDGGMLEKTFKDLHFHVILYQLLRAEEILSSLKEILKHRENPTADGFVCCIISRGTATHLFGTDTNSNCLVLDEIRRLFTGISCPMLVGKPKLFFIQRYSIPDIVLHNRMDHWNEELELDGYDSRSESSSSSSSSIPADADVFWSHCWVDERHLQHGEHHSVYLKALTEALHKAQRRKTNFFDVHIEVNGAVFEHNRRNPGAAYHIDVKHTLRKNIYLE